MRGKVKIIAEAGVNHNGILRNAMRLIEIAAFAGADFVKFQTFNTNELVTEAAGIAKYQEPNNGKITRQQEMLRSLELSENDHYELIKHCKKNDIGFLSTAFDIPSLRFLNKLDLELFKIPSGEITNLPYLKMIAGFGKPIILSTGMSTMDEIDAAVNTLIKNGINKRDITILHCNTEYPTPFNDVNLLAMTSIKKHFDVNVGYSDHTLGVEVPIAAVALGAAIIEKHFTIDRNMSGPDHKASLEPDELRDMVRVIRNIELALGSKEKLVTESELKNKIIARKSIHIAKKISKDHILQEEDLVMKRPGDGISPMRLYEFVGKKVRIDCDPNHKLREEDIL